MYPLPPLRELLTMLAPYHLISTFLSRAQVSVAELNFVGRRGWMNSGPQCEFSHPQIGGERQVTQVVHNYFAGPCRSTARSSSSDREPRLRTERLWQGGNTSNKTKPKAPDFKQKSMKESLWIDEWHNPGLVKNMLGKKEVEKWDSQEVNGGKASGGHAKQEQACSNYEDSGLAEELARSGYTCKIKFRSGVPEDAYKSQQTREASGWEVLSLEGAFSILDRTSEMPSVENFICILQKCRKEKDLAYAKRLHAHICNNGLETHRAVGNYIVPMFVECGSVPDAQQVFNRLAFRNEYSWTSLILGYIQCGQSQHALNMYRKMQEDSVHPSRYTLMALLKACARLKDVERGRELHVEIAQKGFGTDLFVGSTLVDMYAKCGSLSEACEVFDKLPVRDVVLWNSLIAGYAEHGPGEEALKCFEQMQLEGVSPDTVTFACILKACGSIGAVDKGREIHTDIAQKGFERDIFVGSTLVDMYAKCGSLSEAREVFDKLPFRNVVAWTALIAGYAEHGPGQEALKCFEQMQLEGVSPNDVTFICSLKACGSIGALDKGREIHDEIAQNGFERDLFVGSTLIDMYARCGSLSEARKVFDKLPVRNVVSWSAMINGYGMNHEGNLAVQCFEDMREQGVMPNSVTFTCLLTACSRANLVCKGQEYFKVMREEYGIVPTIDHYTCMVDLLARSGHLYEAEKFLETIPCCPSIETWTALISACKTFGEAKLGLRCFQQLVQMDPENAALYVHMASIYVSAGRRDDAYKIEEMRKLAGAKKKPASALIEVDKKVHEFVLGSNQSKEISAMLEVLGSRMKDEGHVPNLDLVLRPISDEEKEAALCEHAEKLALAFGLLNTPQGKTLLVTKNMRMCNNCHNANKIISRIERRDIIVRDGYCVHHFKDGLCSCGVVF